MRATKSRVSWISEPDRYITLRMLADMDPLMKVKVRLRKANGDYADPITVRAGDAVGVYTDDDLYEIEEMQAKDAAFLCPLCGHCEPPCPVNLPVRMYIRDLRDNGHFR